MPALTALRRVSLPAWTAIGATVVFLVVSLVWLISDGRVPFYDSGTHQFWALTYRDAFGDGDVFEWFTADYPPTYPPLVHLVGAAAATLFGVGTTAMVMGQNLVFVPLLALGCYGAATLLFDRRAGALAVIFALSSPLIVDQFHMFLLDAPQTALVALAVWLLLASRRFADDRLAVLAGVATGLALMTKNTSAFFLMGLIAVAFVRGGWRNRRGLVLYALGALAIAGAWHLVHLRDQLRFAGGAAVAGSADIQYDPPALSLADLAWYGWNAANQQLYLPLCLLVLAGLVPVLRRVLPRPARDDQMPELLGGMLVGWFVITLLANNDPRYTMPCLVYLAVIGTGWITTIRATAVRRLAAGAAVAVCAWTFVTTAWGIGPEWRVQVTDAPEHENGQGRLVISRPGSYLMRGPEDGGRLTDVLRAAHDAGAERVAIERSGATAPFFNVPGLTVSLRAAGLEVAPENAYTALGDGDVYLVRTPPGASAAEPCTRVPDGDVYLLRGPDVRPVDEATNLWCPTRSDELYAGPAADQPPSAADRELRAQLRRELRAAARQGYDQVLFEESVASEPGLGGAQALYAEARRAGLSAPPEGLPSTLSPDTGLYVHVSVAPTADPTFPEPCIPLGGPEGQEDGIFLVKGPDKQTLPYADNLICPTRTPPDYVAPLAG